MLQENQFFSECFLNDGHGLYNENIGCQDKSTNGFPLFGYVAVGQTCYNDNDDSECFGCVDVVCGQRQEYQVCRQCMPGLRLETRTKEYLQPYRTPGRWPRGMPRLEVDQVTACTRCPENQTARWNQCVDCPPNSAKLTTDHECICEAGYEPLKKCSDNILNLDATAFVTPVSFAKEFSRGNREFDYTSFKNEWPTPIYSQLEKIDIVDYCEADCRGKEISFQEPDTSVNYVIAASHVDPFCEQWIFSCDACPEGFYKSMVKNRNPRRFLHTKSNIIRNPAFT